MSVFQTTHSSRDEMILEHLSLVKTHAKMLRRRLPARVTFDDLVSAGTMGLIQAVDRFDPARATTFRTYAGRRVWGAMLDFARSEDPLSRLERARRRASDQQHRPVTVSLDEYPLAEHDTSRRRTPTHMWDTAIDLSKARRSLSPRENRVLTLLIDLDAPARVAARELGVHESRVSQIKKNALTKLRGRLK